MKKILLCLTLSLSFCAFSAEDSNLLRNLYTGTRIEFSNRIELSQGQSMLAVASKNCRLRFPKPVYGKKHISKGEHLVVSYVKVRPERIGVNPSTGKPITILEDIEIKFRGIKSRITCRGKQAHKLSVSDLVSDGILNVIEPSKSERYIIE